MPEEALSLSEIYELDPTLHRGTFGKAPSMDLPGANRIIRAKNKVREKQGLPLILGQGAGDGGKNKKDNGEHYPAGDAFHAAFERLRSEEPDFRAVPGSVTGYDEEYYSTSPAAHRAICGFVDVDPGITSFASFGGGRLAIESFAVACATAAAERSKEKKAQIGERPQIHGFGPFSWPGVQALHTRVTGVSLPFYLAAAPNNIFGITPDAVGAIDDFTETMGADISSIYTIWPDNPSGLSDFSIKYFDRILEMTEGYDSKIVIDLFYAFLLNDMGRLRVLLDHIKQLPIEQKRRILLLFGSTKFISDPRYAEWFSFVEDDDFIALMNGNRSKPNGYPTHNGAHIAAALYGAKGGPQAAIGERFEQLQRKRGRLIDILQKHGFPCLPESGSFYVTAFLVDSTGQSLIRDDKGAPSTHPLDTYDVLMKCLVGTAPADVFRPYQSGSLSGVAVRFTAAVRDKDLDALDQYLGVLKDGKIVSSVPARAK